MKKYVAFIPARGGSKSIPLKNIMQLHGHPLIYWTAKAAANSTLVDDVIISTDSKEIKNVCDNMGFDRVHVINRSPETADDTATTESAMLEFATNNQDFENIILIQATSPLLTTDNIDNGIRLYDRGLYDSIFSGVRRKQFLWTLDNERVVPSYNPQHRPRRQDYSGYIVENGAFYITNRKLLLESKCRLSGRIGVCEMTGNSMFEIDEPDDCIIVETLLRKLEK